MILASPRTKQGERVAAVGQWQPTVGEEQKGAQLCLDNFRSVLTCDSSGTAIYVTTRQRLRLKKLHRFLRHVSYVVGQVLNRKCYISLSM